MSTRPTFEDRLLGELTREIELRAAAAESGEAAAGRRTASVSPHRLLASLTWRRIAVIAVACAAAWLAAPVLPGSPADAKAYAVERHGDGSVTLTVMDQDIGIAAQQDLANQLRLNGIHVTVQVIAPGHVCADDRTRIWGVGEGGERALIIPLHWSRETTLRPGNVLVFVTHRGSDMPYMVKVYGSQDEVEPCVPVKPVPPDGER